ncbi:phage tail terminator protein [Rhizobium lusitanum]|uniref:DUF3168 domain-containing protein n=1 Tax=Rhizobium lusitanum TaxID=293958 RepID=A0A1C3USS4_9HYPH|nr:hypothetical protein [Rhizobium lusitanum]SCB18499.1 hypothetical protein GA0061101_103270 [Rhizobium lusitanum]
MITAAIARLKAETTLTDVLAAEDLEALSSGVMPRNRTAYVLPFRENAEPSPYSTGTFRQSVEVYFLVAFFIRRYDDPRGDGRVTEFEATRDEIEGALAGWQWDEQEELVALVATQASASLGKGTSVFVSTWKTTRTVESK